MQGFCHICIGYAKREFGKNRTRPEFGCFPLKSPTQKPEFWGMWVTRKVWGEVKEGKVRSMVLRVAGWPGHMQFQKAEHSTGWCMKMWKNSSICVCWLSSVSWSFCMCVCVCMYVCMYVCVYIYIYIYAYVFVCVYIYIYKTGIFTLHYIFKLSN